MLTNSFGLFMKSHFAWSPRLGVGLLALGLAYAAGGCSFLYDLGTSQCDIDDDCAALGADFADTVCDVEHHVCIDDPNVGGTAGSDGNGGKGGKGGSSSGGDGGSGNGNTGNEGGKSGSSTSGMAGEGGSPTPPECTTNKECIEANVDVAYICKDEKCVKLITDECPLLLPSEGTVALLKSGSPLVLGGFANLTNPDDRRDTPAAINWDLVLQEFNDTTLGGLPIKGGPQPLLALICNGSYPADDTATLPAAVTHLVSEVGVPGVLTTMTSDRLKTAWDLTQEIVKAEDTPRGVLFVSSVAADLALANLEDDGLMWHFLGDPRTTASTLSSLMRRIEPTVEDLRDPADTGPLRVTLIYSSNPTNVDIHTVLTTSDDDHPLVALTFNGKPATDPDNADYFRTVAIPAFAGSQPDVSAAVKDLKDHPPDVIVGLVGKEFPPVISQIENWYAGTDKPVGVAKPHWLLSSSSYNVPELNAVVNVFGSSLSMRLLGVTYAEAQDTKSKTLYNEYYSRLTNFYKGGISVAGTENHYDAAYALLYGVAAANSLNIDGELLLAGLEKVLSKGSMSVDIGPTKISGTISYLSGKTNKMALYGTMGPPDFDTISGTRNNTPTSAWCVSSTGVAQADGLIYDSSSGEFSDGKVVPTCLQQY